MEKREGLDNPQETIDLAWLAGILEADGWITVNAYHDKKARLGWSVSAVVGVCGQDAILIQEVRKIWRRYGVEGCLYEGSTPKGNRTILALSTNKLSGVKIILEKLIGQMRGEKKARAELCLEFVTKRLQKPNSYMDQDDIDILQTWANRFNGIHKGIRNTNLRRILTDFTFPTKNGDDKVGLYEKS